MGIPLLCLPPHRGGPLSDHIAQFAHAPRAGDGVGETQAGGLFGHLALDVFHVLAEQSLGFGPFLRAHGFIQLARIESLGLVDLGSLVQALLDLLDQRLGFLHDFFGRLRGHDSIASRQMLRMMLELASVCFFCVLVRISIDSFFLLFRLCRRSMSICWLLLSASIKPLTLVMAASISPRVELPEMTLSPLMECPWPPSFGRPGPAVHCPPTLELPVRFERPSSRIWSFSGNSMFLIASSFQLLLPSLIFLFASVLLARPSTALSPESTLLSLAIWSLRACTALTWSTSCVSSSRTRSLCTIWMMVWMSPLASAAWKLMPPLFVTGELITGSSYR